ncbi:hypothetical protein IQ07DRAFT_629289, partial [Pyrenochaeta sp. DS3sAY3a]
MVNAPSSARDSLGSDSLSSHQDAFHAFSTISDIALESRTALKEGVSSAIPVPPRMSSKHQSFSQLEQEVPDASTLPGSAPSDKGKGKAVLGRDELSTPEMNAYAFLGGEQSVEGSPEKSESSPNKDDTPTPSRPLLGHRPVAPGQEAGRSRSLWNLATGSRRNRPESLHDDTDSSIRVKHLSRTSTPDSGPVLRISGDADEILSDKQVLSSSSSSKGKPKKAVRIAPGHRSVRTSFSSPSVKVNPIRSMRPARMRIGSEPSSSANASPASTISTQPGTPTSVPGLARAAAPQEMNRPQASGSKDTDITGAQDADKENIESINVESSSSTDGRIVQSRQYGSSPKYATSDACSPKTPATAQSGLLQVPSSGGMQSAANMSPVDTIETADPSIQGESPLAKRSFRDMFKSKHAEEESSGTEPS